MASLDQMEGDTVEFGLLILVVLIIAALILAAKGSFGLLNWLKGLLAKIAAIFSGLTNKVPGQTFSGVGNGTVQSGKSAVTNVTGEFSPSALNSTFGSGTVLGGFLDGSIPIDYGTGAPVDFIQGIEGNGTVEPWQAVYQ